MPRFFWFFFPLVSSSSSPVPSPLPMLALLASPGLPRKTEEYKTPLLAASLAARASGGDDHSLRGHHLPMASGSWSMVCCEAGGCERGPGVPGERTSSFTGPPYESDEEGGRTSGVLAPSVCDVESALLRVPPSPFVDPPSSGGLVPSLSSITRSIGILPFRQLMYRWQKLSHSSCTFSSSRR